MKLVWQTIFPLAVLFVLPGCGDKVPQQQPAEGKPGPVATAEIQPTPERPTFTEHIAPMMFNQCVPCHRPGQVAPFSLITYDDVRKRAKQLVEVTDSRYMPPFLPDASATDFRNARHLHENEIEGLKRWVEQDCPEGDPAKLPTVPEFSSDWQLGEPDLIVEMDREYTLPPEGENVFRHFVIPMPNKKLRYVRGFEFRTTNPRIVHHARFLFDATTQSRQLDEADPEPGFALGMGAGSGRDPDGHWLGWTPGKQPVLREKKYAWLLKPGQDLVVELHMLPTGKPEPVKCSLAFYFSDEPPTDLPVIIRMGPTTIDIPPGENNYEHAEQFTIPADVDLLNVYPHAHLLGKTMESYATLPDGNRLCLIKIDDWDFNWQDEYQFEDPIRLPRGSVIDMKFTYDNSTDNVRNPNSPPKRVLQGSETSDEMGDLWFQMVPVSRVDRPVVYDAVMRREARWVIREAKFLAEQNPTPKTLAHYGSILQMQRNYDEARRRYTQALNLDPKLTPALTGLGIVEMMSQNYDRAATALERALKSRPDDPTATRTLGLVRVQQKRHMQAIPLLRKFLLGTRNDSEAWLHLALCYEATNETEAARQCVDYSLKLNPSSNRAMDLKARLSSGRKK